MTGRYITLVNIPVTGIDITLWFAPLTTIDLDFSERFVNFEWVTTDVYLMVMMRLEHRAP